MPSAVSHIATLRTTLANAVATTAFGANCKLKIYSGSAPANADAALSGNVLISTITGITFGTASAGVATVSGSTADPSAVGGTASFFRITTSADVVQAQGLCGTSASDLNLNSLTIGAGANVSLTGSNTYTAST